MRIVSFLPFIAFSTTLLATDWPQYRGPNGDGSTPDRIAATWPATPKVLWKVKGGTGFSSFVVGGNRCYTIEGRDQGGLKEVLVARDVATGAEVWTAVLGNADYGMKGGDEGAKGNNGGDGPRSTPAIAGKNIITVNPDLVVEAHDAATGKPVWKR